MTAADALLGLLLGLSVAGVFTWALFSWIAGWMDGDFDGSRVSGYRESDGHRGLAQVAYERAFKRATDKAAIVKERNAKRDTE